MTSISRRDCLRLGLLGGLGLMLPRGLFAAEPAGVSDKHQRGTLILIELAGGNDGLNTFIPLSDPLYKKARPNIALSSGWDVADGWALHPALTPLKDVWNAKHMAIVPGLGYTKPNRSHFRSIDIWQTAGTGEVTGDKGWASRVISQLPKQEQFAEAVILGGGGLGPAAGGGIRALAMKEPDRFVKDADRAPMVEMGAKTENPALDHVLAVGEGIRDADDVLTKRLEAAPQKLAVEFPDTSLGKQCATAARLVRLGATPPLIHLRLRGFDTHSDQLNRQEVLLTDLATSIAALRTDLMAAGAWENTTIATYSEFGRRVAENGSAGTDHGAANTHFVFGGRIKGGINGEHPSLANLHRGDLIHTQNMHDYWRGLAHTAWGADTALVTGQAGNMLNLSA